MMFSATHFILRFRKRKRFNNYLRSSASVLETLFLERLSEKTEPISDLRYDAVVLEAH